MAAPLIEVADCTESGNNTATTSWDVSYPAYVSGDLLCFHVASDANVTHNWSATGPNGETVVDITDSYGGTAQRISAFYFVGSATTGASTFTVTPSASEQWTAVVVKVPAGEFDSTTPVQTTIGSANQTTAAVDIATPTWTTGSRAGGRIVVAAAIDVVTTSAAPAGWTALIQRDRGAVGIMVGVRTAETTTSESVASATFTKASETHSVIGYVINGPPASLAIEHGSFTLTGYDATFEKGDSVRQGGDPAPLPHLGLVLGSSAAPEIAIEHGSFALTGQAASLRVGRQAAFAHGSFSLTGQDAGLRTGRSIAFAYDTFTLNGHDVDLDADRRLAADYGAYSLTGQDVDLDADRRLVLEYGAFTLTGQDVGLGSQLGITAGLGSFTLSGQDVDLDADRKIAFAHGAFALTGQDADLDADRRLAFEYGSFTLNGQDVGLSTGTSQAQGGDPAPFPHLGLLLGQNAREIQLEHGSFVLTGQASGLAAGRKVASDHGSFTLSGQDVAFRAVGAIALDPAAFTLSGEVALRHASNLTAGMGSFTLSGQPMDFQAVGGGGDPAPFPHLGLLLAPTAGAYSIGAEFGAFALTGQSIALSTPTVFSIEYGSFVLTGQDADRDISMSAGLGSFTLSGQAVTFGGALSISAERGNFTLSGQSATLRVIRSYDLALASGSYTLTGRSVDLDHDRRLSAGSGAFALSGQAADLDADRRLVLGTGSYTVTGNVASFRQGVSLQAATGVFTLTGQNANLAASFLRIDAEAGSFSLTGQDVDFLPRKITAETGLFDLLGQDVSLVPQIRVSGGGSPGPSRDALKKFRERFNRATAFKGRVSVVLDDAELDAFAEFLEQPENVVQLAQLVSRARIQSTLEDAVVYGAAKVSWEYRIKQDDEELLMYM
jgi:hypothetical protein